MNGWGWMLKKAGWQFLINVDLPPKCVVCVAPHTSNWDFVLGELSIRSVGRTAGFLMKSTWFFFPLGGLLRRIGGIAVRQHQHTNVTDQVVDEFNAKEQLMIAVTPEGTRSPNPNWHKGFLYIARQANVPVVLAYIDYGTHTVCLDRLFTPSDDVEADMRTIKEYYRGRTARFPEKFVM
ncbi:MAG: 1-acyl-sn-glycerol-3-phosphate acyltransferase [Muribaculaceae bacterium]|nr:1-acyl-sn-glycerol-3-phosphate acyltransferase [Muribaculaceae bacterium]